VNILRNGSFGWRLEGRSLTPVAIHKLRVIKVKLTFAAQYALILGLQCELL